MSPSSAITQYLSCKQTSLNEVLQQSFLLPYLVKFRLTVNIIKCPLTSICCNLKYDVGTSLMQTETFSLHFLFWLDFAKAPSKSVLCLSGVSTVVSSVHSNGQQGSRLVRLFPTLCLFVILSSLTTLILQVQFKQQYFLNGGFVGFSQAVKHTASSSLIRKKNWPRLMRCVELKATILVIKSPG